MSIHDDIEALRDEVAQQIEDDLDKMMDETDLVCVRKSSLVRVLAHVERADDAMRDAVVAIEEVDNWCPLCGSFLDTEDHQCACPIRALRAALLPEREGSGDDA